MQRPVPCVSRRALLGAAGVGALALTACSGGDEDLPQVTGTGPGTALAALQDVPVGGALLVEVDGRRVLVTRTAEDTVAGFDAECPHQGCTVRPGTDGGLQCPCHGSEFDPATGDVLQGPASEALAPVEVVIAGDQVELA